MKTMKEKHIHNDENSEDEPEIDDIDLDDEQSEDKKNMKLADEYGNEFDLEQDQSIIQQEQDINEEDRQVLNDRILGIINAF